MSEPAPAPENPDLVTVYEKRKKKQQAQAHALQRMGK